MVTSFRRCPRSDHQAGPKGRGDPAFTKTQDTRPQKNTNHHPVVSPRNRPEFFLCLIQPRSARLLQDTLESCDRSAVHTVHGRSFFSPLPPNARPIVLTCPPPAACRSLPCPALPASATAADKWPPSRHLEHRTLFSATIRSRTTE